MKTIPNQRRARPCLQLWHLAGVAPTLVAALALPGTAKAAVDRTSVQRAEPSASSCSAVRIENLEALIELGCVPAMPRATASEATAFVLSEPIAPSSPPAPEVAAVADAADAAARCAIWTTVPDLDADVAIPSYCSAPPQTVLAARSAVAPVAPVAQPAMQVPNHPRLEDAALAGGFYAVDDFYAQPALEENERIPIVDYLNPADSAPILESTEVHSGSRTLSDSKSFRHYEQASDADAPSSIEASNDTNASSSAKVLDRAEMRSSTEISVSAGLAGSAEIFNSITNEGADTAKGAEAVYNRETGRIALGSNKSRARPAVRDSGASAAELATGRTEEAAIESTAISTSSPAAQAPTWSPTLHGKEEPPQSVHIEPPIIRAATVQDQVGSATKVSDSAPNARVTLTGDTLAVSRPAPEHQTGVDCTIDRDVALDSAMPTYCVAALQTVVAARTLSGASTRSDEAQLTGRRERALAVDAEQVLDSTQTCAAASEDLADSAMPSYCTAPEQTILAGRSQAANVQVRTEDADPTTEHALETVAVPEALLGTKMVALEELSETRGGFETTDRGQTLRISFGIERAVFVNGALVSTSTLALDGLARMTNVGAGAQGANVRAVSSTANAVRNGADNVLSIGAQELPAGALIVQNSLNNQRLDANTVVNAVVEASGLLRATRLEAAMREATTGALRR